MRTPAYNPLMHPLAGVSLWAEGRDGLAHPLDPDLLARAHPAWRTDVDAHAPWTLEDGFYRAGGAGRGHAVCVCGECSSSLDVARLFCAEGALPEWGAVLALDQWAGRGQLRRRWRSGPGDLMAAWRWPVPPAHWANLVPLMAGYHIALELGARGVPVRVKWPNDILLEDRKVGGVLVEERGGALLVGVGLNLHTAPEDAELRDDEVPRAAALGDALATKSIISWWQSLVNRADSWYISEVSGGGPAHFLESFSTILAWKGRKVSVRAANGVYSAFVSGLAPDGGLRLAREGREEVLYAGSISLPR